MMEMFYICTAHGRGITNVCWMNKRINDNIIKLLDSAMPEARLVKWDRRIQTNPPSLHFHL